MVASGDMAHATHPNYPERHEPGHLIEVNAGPVLKVQPNLRYATDGRTAAAFALACAQAGVPLQRYEHRADLPCGSTIGPMTAARTGIPTVDVGAAQLAMHSAREVMGADDVAAYSAALGAFLSPRSGLDLVVADDVLNYHAVAGADPVKAAHRERTVGPGAAADVVQEDELLTWCAASRSRCQSSSAGQGRRR